MDEQTIDTRQPHGFSEPELSIGALEAGTAGELIAASADVAMVVDDAGTILDLAFGNDDLRSQPLPEWLGQAWASTVTDDSRPKVDALLRDAADGRPPRWRQVNQVVARGGQIPLLFSAVRMPAGSTTVGRTLVFGRDMRATSALQQRLIEAQQSMEREYARFRAAETRYRHLFQVSAEGVLVVDTAQRVLEANPAAAELLGVPVEKLVGGAFPVGLAADQEDALAGVLAGVRASGRADALRCALDGGRGEVTVAVTSFRQDRGSVLMVRLSRATPDEVFAPAQTANAMLLKLARSAPDCLVVTDLDGRVLSANTAFLELAQVPHEEQARGESLDRWLGRTGVDLSVLLSNLRQRGSVRLFATTLRGELGSTTEVEISAAQVPDAKQPFLGFTIRDVGRRLTPDASGRKELPRSVAQLTELVGRVPLKDIVGETTELIEQLCIQAALELTRDNRASAAEMLGLSRQSLYVKLRRYNLGDLPQDEDR